jgi:folate-binding protein YgfZ
MLNPAAPRGNRDGDSHGNARVKTMSRTSQSPALDRAELIEIAGADAIAFAHAQFSSDVAGLGTRAWQWSAWLTAQGRVRGVFALLRVEKDRLLLWLPLGGARAMRDALARYVLRAKVRLDVFEEWALHGSGDAATPAPSTIVERDGGYLIALPGARAAWLGDSRPTQYDRDALNAWRRADVAAALPWIASATEDEFVPQALDLGQLDAIRFDKGCFPGQEIAARLHFRGGVKQRLRRAALHGAGEVAPGLRIDASGSAVGVVLYGARTGAETFYALAVVNDNAPADAHLASSNGHRIQLQ